MHLDINASHGCAKMSAPGRQSGGKGPAGGGARAPPTRSQNLADAILFVLNWKFLLSLPQNIEISAEGAKKPLRNPTLDWKRAAERGYKKTHNFFLAVMSKILFNLKEVEDNRAIEFWMNGRIPRDSTYYYKYGNFLYSNGLDATRWCAKISTMEYPPHLITTEMLVAFNGATSEYNRKTKNNTKGTPKERGVRLLEALKQLSDGLVKFDKWRVIDLAKKFEVQVLGEEIQYDVYDFRNYIDEEVLESLTYLSNRRRILEVTAYSPNETSSTLLGQTKTMRKTFLDEIDFVSPPVQSALILD